MDAPDSRETEREGEGKRNEERRKHSSKGGGNFEKFAEA
jgi:hypothetical protein